MTFSMSCFSGKKQMEILNVINPELQIFAPESKLIRTTLGRDLDVSMNSSLKTSLTSIKRSNTQLSCRIPFTEFVVNTTLHVKGLSKPSVVVVAGRDNIESQKITRDKDRPQ